MYKNYIKVAFRNLFRNRGHSLMNILGLSAGLACAIVVLLYVQSEITYDRYHTDKDRIYRLGSEFILNEGTTDRFALSSPFLGPMLAEENPGIESFCRLRYIPKLKASSTDTTDYEENILWADSTVFDFFTTQMVYGDSAQCLVAPNSIVLSESLAKKYFGNRDPRGDTLITSNRYKYVVTGVFKDLPENTHHFFNGLISYSTVDPFNYKSDEGLGRKEIMKIKLWSVRDYSFVKLKEGYTPTEFYEFFPCFFYEYMVEMGLQIAGDDIEDSFRPVLEPISSVHLYSDLTADHFQSGNATYIYAFSVIGFFILLLAGINYVNMTTARSVTRIREVGLRKVLGSRQRHLVFQFLGESMLLSAIALILALAFVEVTLSATSFNAMMDKHLELDLWGNPNLTYAILGITFFLGLLSGLYPAFFMSSITPAWALRRRSSKGGSLALRKSLVVFQFSISIAVIVGTFLMRNQVDYVRNMDLGFNTENICVIPVRDSVTQSHLPEIREELESHPDILATTTAWGVPAHSIRRMVFWVEDEEGRLGEEVFDFLPVGEDYINGMGLELVEGRDFKPSDTSVSEKLDFIVNETAAKKVFKGNPIGKTMEWGLNIEGMKRFTGEVVGVVKDFKFSSLHDAQEPLFLIPRPEQGGMLHIRLKGDNVVETMDFIEKLWEPNEAEGSPFSPLFINDQFDKLYAADQRQSSLMGILAGICIIISILGLLGFASYTIEQRRREIGIRKVLGATTWRILSMLLWEVFLLVLLSSFIAAILGYLGIQWWLAEFAYRAAIPVELFFYSGFIALFVALSAVAIQTIRAALSSPALALKYE